VLDGKVLSPRQIDVIKEIAEERGHVEGLRRRQRIQWRLKRLRELDLKYADRETVERFTAESKRASGLADTKLPVVTAIEMQYPGQREEATARRAQQIAELLNGRRGSGSSRPTGKMSC